MRSNGDNQRLPARRVVVIGYGNTLRSDDAAGPTVAQRLMRSFRGAPVDIHICHQLLPEHSASISGAGLVVFIDASAEQPAGEVRIEPIEPSGAYAMSLGHHLGPETLLSWVTGLYGDRPQAQLCSIGVESLEHGEGLSETVAKAVTHATEQIRRKIRQFLHEDHSRSKEQSHHA